MIIIKSQDGTKIEECKCVCYEKTLSPQAKEELNKIRKKIMEKAYHYGSTKNAEEEVEKLKLHVYNDEHSYEHNITNNGHWLGTYESEKRAKEVMEKIEHHIRKLYTSKIASNMINYTSDEVMTINDEAMMEEAIFTMPEE